MTLRTLSKDRLKLPTDVCEEGDRFPFSIGANGARTPIEDQLKLATDAREEGGLLPLPNDGQPFAVPPSGIHSFNRKVLTLI